MAGYSSQEQLGDALGVSFTTIARWEKDQSPIPSDKLVGMGNLGLDAVYILTGKTGDVAGFSEAGSPEYRGAAKTANEKPATSPVLDGGILAAQAADGTWDVTGGDGTRLHGTQEDISRSLRKMQMPKGYIPAPDDYDWVPLFDIDTNAETTNAVNLLGGGKFLTYLAFSKYSLESRGLQTDALACVRTGGDSMLPTIQAKDTVMIDMRQTTADSGIFVFRVDGALYLKRLVREGAGVRVISDNPLYPSWLIPADKDFRVIGKLAWHARWGE